MTTLRNTIWTKVEIVLVFYWSVWMKCGVMQGVASEKCMGTLLLYIENTHPSQTHVWAHVENLFTKVQNTHPKSITRLGSWGT